MSFTAHSVGMVFTWLVESYHKSGQHKHQNMPGTSSKSTYELLCLSRSVICDTYQLLNLKDEKLYLFCHKHEKNKKQKKNYVSTRNRTSDLLNCHVFIFFSSILIQRVFSFLLKKKKPWQIAIVWMYYNAKSKLYLFIFFQYLCYECVLSFLHNSDVTTSL